MDHNMMMSIMDTSIVVASKVPYMEGELAVSSATVAELSFGVLVAKDADTRARRLRRLAVLRDHIKALPIDDAVADSYGQMAAAVAAVGRQPRARTMDLLIAATAHAHNARLYTRNASDLVGLEDLVEIVAI
jgi:predicted nucleic acid-binding protein